MNPNDEKSRTRTKLSEQRKGLVEPINKAHQSRTKSRLYWKVFVILAVVALVSKTLWQNLQQETIEYRALSDESTHQSGNVQIRFGDDVTMGDIQAFIQQEQLTLISGPDAQGIFHFASERSIHPDLLQHWQKDGRTVHVGKM